MSQMLYYHVSSTLRPLRVSTVAMSSTTSISGGFQLRLDTAFETDEPVRVNGDELEIDETLVKDAEIYPVRLKGEQFYVRKNNGAIELFQLEEHS
jgi:hypothetical protein